MKYKTRELEGAFLDAAVALAEGAIDEGADWFFPATKTVIRKDLYLPSSSWNIGGPIIDREGIQLAVDKRSLSIAAGLPEWDAVIGGYVGLMRDAGWESAAHTCGPTPLIAAMRAYVASKFGEEVEL